MELYVVQTGDTVFSIARAFGVSTQRLIADNGLEQTGTLIPGQVLVILIPKVTYTVQKGDTLFSIAQKNATTVNSLLRHNPWYATGQPLLPGAVLTIAFTHEPNIQSRINGYAYPFISETLLRRELPFLSTLTIFGYGFTDDGVLISPNDSWMLRLCQEAGVAPILLLSSITEDGNFSSERASTLFQTQELQDTVLNSIVAVMQEKGYRGLDIDFEYVRPEDATAFLGFVQNAVNIMHEYGYFVNVDLAPKTSVDQPGLLYEAHDYAALGAIADTVLLMTYEWGYTYGPPMAVAPIGPVTRVVNFGLSQIPAEKVMMGIPNYGYDWTLPFQKGITRAVTVGNQYAVALAQRFGATILFDEESQAPYFNYRNAGADHVVWFEDARSIRTKLNLMLTDNLLGPGYWNLMRPFAQNWAYISALLIPMKVE